MIHEINSILPDCEPSIYLYGSSVLDDFRLGWSDIDILVLTNKQISEEQAQKLVKLRQTMLEKEPGNPYLEAFYKYRAIYSLAESASRNIWI